MLVTADYNGYPFFPGFTSKTNRKVLSSAEYSDEEIVISIDMDRQVYTVSYGRDKESLQELCVTDGRLINTEQVGCMAGTQIGMYATGNGTDSSKWAAFDWYKYQEL